MRVLSLSVLIAVLAAPAAGQLLPPVGGPGPVGGGALRPLDPLLVPTAAPMLGGPIGISGLVDAGAIPAARALADLRRERLRQLVRSNRDVLEADPQDNPVRRAELLALNLPAAALAQLTAQGFAVVRREGSGAGGSGAGGSGAGEVTILRPSAKLKLEKALAALRAAAPGIVADYNHVYEPAGAALQAAPGAAMIAANAGSTGNASIGMIDGGVAAHPALAGARIEQRGFAGTVKATGHGTAVASLLVGDAAGFRGAARGARLLVADVYGGAAGNGSAQAIAQALDWLGGRGAQVINISLVGPPNLLMARSIAAIQAKGIVVVAAVGNDGPAAPPMYPASYPQVVAVTAVDAKARPLIEAGRAVHTDFAAPGADMAAALIGGGYTPVRGTSFAAPLVAARLAAHPANPLVAVAAEARTTGNKRIGMGIVCETCRNNPRLLREKK
jgi:hypothetical protein